VRNLLLPAALQVALFAVVFAEIFLPSGGLLLLVSAGLLIASWVLLIGEGNGTAILLFLALDLVGLPLLLMWGLKMLRRSPMALGSELGSDAGYRVREAHPESWVGREAVTVGVLRPMGQVEIDGVLAEAASEGSYVEAGRRVRIVALRDSGVIVQPIEE
jgi:membrane-bound serine protease (ClpP class)